MYRLRRLYLDQIGVDDNRFSDITVELTGLDGEPTDSIVWLRNGAGKTTMLSLLLALILPGRRDFLATRIKNRTLEDLILSGDTSHVCAEWVDPNGSLLLTGAVYEWAARIRPRDYNGASKDKLNRTWWCASPEPSLFGSGLDDLPFTTRSIKAGHPVDLEGFKSHIRGLAASGVNATVVDKTISEWHQALRERRFDPDLYRYFADLNASEGGMDKLFEDITSPGAFVRRLLHLVSDEHRAELVRNLLSETAVEISKRPAYLAERDFCIEAVPKIKAFGDAHAKVAEAAAGRDVAQAEAAGFKRALLDAAEAAESDAEAASQRRRLLGDEYDEARRAAETSRSIRNEYLRLGAEFRRVAAAQSEERARRELEEATIRAEAWVAAGDWAEVQIAGRLLEDRKVAMRAAQKDAAPVLDRLEVAKALWAGTLDAAIAASGEEREAQATARDEAVRERHTAEKAGNDAAAVLARLEADEANAAQVVAEHETALNRLSAEGTLETGESLTGAKARLEGTAAAEETRAQALVEQIAELDGQASGLQSSRPGLASTAQERRLAADRVSQRLELLTARAATLADRVRVRDLLQDDAPDVLVSGGDLLRHLAEAAAASEVQVLDERALAAEAERSAHALDVEGLLPPRAAVVSVLDALSAAGVTAYSGWRYLAENHHDPAEHEGLIAALPEVCDGVVVYGDPAGAATLLDSLELTDAVVIAPAAVFSDPGVAKVVVGPAPARHDMAAGALEADRLRRLLERSAERIQDLTARRERDHQLSADVRTLLADLPVGGLIVLRAELEAAERQADEAADALKAADFALEDARSRRSKAQQAVGDAKLAATRAADAARRVNDLIDSEEQRVGLARGVLQIAGTHREAARQAAALAEERKREADKAVDAAKARILELDVARKGWATSRSPLGPATNPAGTSMEAAAASVEELTRQWREAYPESDLRRLVLEAEDDVRKRSQPWERHSAEVQELAVTLAATPAGVDADLRAEEARRAQEAFTDIAGALKAAQIELNDAGKELDDRTPRDRLRWWSDLAVVPVDRAEALSLAEAEDAVATGHQDRAGGFERERDAAAREAEALAQRAGLLRDQADKLHGIEAADAASGIVSFDDDEVRSEVARLVAQVDVAEGAWNTAQTGRSRAGDDLRQWANQDRFAKVAADAEGVATLRERLRSANLVETVAPRAGSYVEELARRQELIAAQLEQVEQTKRNVVERLATLVDESLTVIIRASSLSELPAGTGAWDGARFLDVAPRTRPGLEQISLRVSDLVDQMVAHGRLEIDPLELLWKATEASVTDGFKATVLKPAPEQPTRRTPVEEMSKWSGGENLTASLILFCVLARLRNEQRTGSRGGASGGLVPLDNPLGKANYLPFLELQRRVARATKVQLVFWTGIGDLGAVTVFPRIVAMHKRKSLSRPGVAYTMTDEGSTAIRPDPMEVAATGAVRAES